MTTQTEALKLLVEALSLYETRTDGLVNKALAAGKEALAQPEQEPVAWRAWFDADNSAKWLFTLWPEEEHPSFDWQPLYTTPPQPKEPEQEPVTLTNTILRRTYTPSQRKPLTRGQIREIEVDVSLNPSFDYITPAEQLCRAIEAAHGIKE